jgi:Zn-finger nucleic acid-binding protein
MTIAPYREDSRAPCPRCDGGLDPADAGDLSLRSCHACGGVFLAPDALHRISASRELPVTLREELPDRPRTAEGPVRYLSCPDCAKSMNRRNFGRISGVIVDVCRDHGVWFDAGELAAVLAFIADGGLEKAKKREEEERLATARAPATERPSAFPPRHDPSAETLNFADVVARILGDLFSA